MRGPRQRLLDERTWPLFSPVCSPPFILPFAAAAAVLIIIPFSQPSCSQDTCRTWILITHRPQTLLIVACQLDMALCDERVAKDVRCWCTFLTRILLRPYFREMNMRNDVPMNFSNIPKRFHNTICRKPDCFFVHHRFYIKILRNISGKF